MSVHAYAEWAIGENYVAGFPSMKTVMVIGNAI